MKRREDTCHESAQMVDRDKQSVLFYLRFFLSYFFWTLQRTAACVWGGPVMSKMKCYLKSLLCVCWDGFIFRSLCRRIVLETSYLKWLIQSDASASRCLHLHYFRAYWFSDNEVVLLIKAMRSIFRRRTANPTYLRSVCLINKWININFHS